MADGNIMVTDAHIDHRERFFLRALREVGALDAVVTSAGTPEELADETNVSLPMARFSLETMSSLGYLTRVEETYEPTNELLGILATKDVRSIGTLPANLDDADSLVDLGARLAGSEVPDEDEQTMVNSLGAAAARDRATVRAVCTAVLRGNADVTDALVLNGAPGRLAVELTERGVDVTLVDDPTAVATSEGILARTGVTTVPTSDWEGLPTSEFVVAAPGFRRDPVAQSRLLRVASSVLDQDGFLVLVDRYHEEGDGDPLAAVMDVARTGRPRDRSLPELRSTIEQNGLTLTAIDPIPGTEFVAVRSTRSRD